MYFETTAQKFHYGIMSTGELKVMLQGVYKTRSENDDPTYFFRPPPILVARRWSYL